MRAVLAGAVTVLAASAAVAQVAAIARATGGASFEMDGVEVRLRVIATRTLPVLQLPENRAVAGDGRRLVAASEGRPPQSVEVTLPAAAVRAEEPAGPRR